MRENSPVDQAYSYIKKLIVTKTLYPGNRIVEEDISRETGISRTPIRTALLRLSYEGMVEQQPNRGSFVAKPSMTDLDQVYELRVLLEVGAFRAAIRHPYKPLTSLSHAGNAACPGKESLPYLIPLRLC